MIAFWSRPRLAGRCQVPDSPNESAPVGESLNANAGMWKNAQSAMPFVAKFVRSGFRSHFVTARALMWPRFCSPTRPGIEGERAMRIWTLGATALAVGFVSIVAAVDARTYGAKDIVGIARVVDGDGISVGDIPDIRLQGVAAPENNGAKREPGGPESTANLRAFVEGKSVVCKPDGTRTRGRPVAVCFLGEKDIGLHQVETGHARDCPRFSGRRYADAEARARAGGRDLRAIYPLPAYCVQR